MSKKTRARDFECVECGRRATQIHHLLYGVHRKKADKDGLTVPLCGKCHYRLHNVDPEMAKRYKQQGQRLYEEQHGHEAFIKRYGKNYL
jgi:Zn ribbon nucleic-acid-binding protein